MERGSVTIRSLLVGSVFAALFALVTVYFENRPAPIYLTASQIAVLPYILLFLTVLLINPVCRLIRVVRAFSVTEILLVFVMCSVSAGISTFGLASQLVPIIGNLFNPSMNTAQNNWDLYVEPYVNDAYFVSEPGSHEAAKRLRAAHEPWEKARKVLSAAQNLQKSRDELVLSQKMLDEAERIPDKTLKAKRTEALQRRLTLAQNSVKKMEKWWDAYKNEHKRDEVLRDYPAKTEALKAEMDRLRAELDTIKTGAFDKVATFRKGLPKGMRAMPGLLYVPGEGTTSYVDRVRRLTHGTSALADLREADKLLGDAIRTGERVDAGIAEHIGRAVRKLEPISATEEVEAQRQALKDEIDLKGDLQHEGERRLRSLHERRRYVHEGEADALTSEINDEQSYVDGLKADTAALQKELDDFVEPRLMRIRTVRETRATLEALHYSLAARAPPPYPELQDRLRLEMDRFRSFDASWPRFLAGDVPWSHWLRPLCNWAVIIALTYVVFMTLNLLMFRQWAHHERLIYPLAQLPELLAGSDAPDERGGVPSIFRNGLFWGGFGIAGAIMGWNMICNANLVPGLTAITLDIGWGPYVQFSAFAPLGGFRFSIFFTMIGLAFLIPARISFSLWFFWLFCGVQLVLLTWLGYGTSAGLLGPTWESVMNFQMAQAGGALMVFAAVILFKCRRYFLCFFMPGLVRDLESAERAELRVSSFLFFFGSVGLILFLSYGLGANICYTIGCYCVILAIAIGLTRAVAEGGILGFQYWVGPFHFIRTLFGMDKAWTAPGLYAPLVMYNTLLLQETKTFIMPAMANGLKIGSDMKMKRLRFHLAIVLCLVIAMAVALLAQVVLSYDRGADHMNWWFHNMVPAGLFGTVAGFVKNLEVDNTAVRWWLLFGAVFMAGLLYMRRHCFWLPHPIGLIMLANILMGVYWFSIFLGWAAKSLVAKYGNKETYERFRGFFIGLIVGELFIVVLCVILGYLFSIDGKVHLNRQ